MAELQLDLHPNQLKIYDDPAKVKVICCGRRFGKTVLAGNVVVTKAFSLPNSMSWIVSPRYSQTMIMWRKITKLIPKQYITDSSKGDLWIELENGSMIFAKSADNPDGLVGEGLDLLVVDEAARVKPEAWEVSLQPTLMDSDGEAMLLSTPKGKNWFYTEYLKGQNKEDFPEYSSFHFTSYDNPFLKKEVIDRKIKTMSHIFYKQEILAEFIDDGGEVFGMVDQCIYNDTFAEEPIAGRDYVMGVDLAKYDDFTVITVIDTLTRKVVFFKRLPHMDWSPQKDIIESIHLRWNNARMLMDATGVGDPIVEDLEKRCIDVVPYKFSGNTLKKQVIEGLAVAFQNREVFIPRDNILLGELGAFSYEKLPSGLLRYSAPTGFHDDCVISLALAVWGLEKEYGCRVVGMMADTEDITDSSPSELNRIIEEFRQDWDEDDERLINYDED